MQPFDHDPTVLLGYTGGFTFYFPSWWCFRYGFDIIETPDVFLKENQFIYLN